MVHPADEEAQVNEEQLRILREGIRKQPHYGEKTWLEMTRPARQRLLNAAYTAEQGLSLQIKEARRILEDHSEIRRALPDLKGEVLTEAQGILVSKEQHFAALDLQAAFDASREAWLLVPTFKRHELRDKQLKKQALKLIQVMV